MQEKTIRRFLQGAIAEERVPLVCPSVAATCRTILRYTGSNRMKFSWKMKENSDGLSAASPT